MKGSNQITSDELLLVELCRLDFSREQKIILLSLAEKITDWDHFIELVNLHGVDSLVYHNLEKLQILNILPNRFSAYLKNSFLLNLCRNIQLTRFLEESLGILNNLNIKTVLLKGIALEHTVYGNQGLRQMNDIDVLVPQNEIMLAYNALLSEGFVPQPVKSHLHKPILPFVGKHLPTLIKNGIAIELHHELFGFSERNLTKSLIDSSHEILISGKKAFIPDNQIFFLYLIKHLQKHEENNYSQLRLYTDLVILIEKYSNEILNEELFFLANKAKLDKVLASKLICLKDFWDISFTENYNKFISKHSVPGSQDRFKLLLKNPKSAGEKKKIYKEIIKEIPGIHRKLLFIAGDLFPTLSFMKKRYRCKSSFLAFLYYPQRFGKIILLLSFREK